MEEIRKRYYTVSQNFRWKTSDYEFVNRGDVLVHTMFPGAYITQGAHEHMFPGNNNPMCVGLPILRGQPIIKVGITRQPIDAYEFGSHFFVSTRAKLLLESIDPDGFEFVECRTMDRKGKPFEPYWMMAVDRAIEDFDRARSNFVTYAQRHQETPDSDFGDRHVVQLNDIYMPKGFNGSWHVFSINNVSPDIVFDQAIVDAWRLNKFNSWFFTPLQQPIKGEYKPNDYGYFYNNPYWSERLGS